MIPVLYSNTETAFTSNGLGRLAEALSVTVTEERNGAFEMEMVLPVDAVHFSDISLGCFITAKPSPTRDAEPFEIYSIEKNMDGMTATIRGQHISYRLSLIPVEPFTANSAANALAGIKSNSVETNPFTFYTDITSAGTYTQTVPSSAKNRLLGEQGSVLQVWNGEYEWEKFAVRLLASRGVDRSMTIRYGKNLTSLKQEENIQNTITGIMPFWSRTEEDGSLSLLTLTEKVLYASNAGLYPFNRTIVMDFSEKFQEAPTEAELRTACQAYIDNNNIGTPLVSFDVSFAALSQTTEYENIGLLERVDLCDTVGVEFPDFNTSATAKVVKTVFDSLTERYNNVEIGDIRSSLSKTIASTEAAAEEAVTESRNFMQEALAIATAVLNGDITGSSMKTITDADGNPQGWIVMDTQDESTAVNCIRCNVNGIGFSTSGVNGPYETAIYYDSNVGDWVINANLLNVLNLNASNITAGTITGIAINNGSGTFSVDSSGNVVANSLTSTDATITGGSIAMETDSSSKDFISLTYNGSSSSWNSTHSSTGFAMTHDSSSGFDYLNMTPDTGIYYQHRTSSGSGSGYYNWKLSNSGLTFYRRSTLSTVMDLYSTASIASGTYKGNVSVSDQSDQSNVLTAVLTPADGVIRYTNGNVPIDGDKTVTAASGVTFARKHLRVFGKMAFFSGVFTSTSAIASGSKIATLSIAGKEVTDFTLSTSAGTTAQAVVNGSNFNANGSLAANTNYFFNGTFYVG